MPDSLPVAGRFSKIGRKDIPVHTPTSNNGREAADHAALSDARGQRPIRTPPSLLGTPMERHGSKPARVHLPKRTDLEVKGGRASTEPLPEQDNRLRTSEAALAVAQALPHQLPPPLPVDVCAYHSPTFREHRVGFPLHQICRKGLTPIADEAIFTWFRETDVSGGREAGFQLRSVHSGRHLVPKPEQTVRFPVVTEIVVCGFLHFLPKGLAESAYHIDFKGIIAARPPS